MGYWDSSGNWHSEDNGLIDAVYEMAPEFSTGILMTGNYYEVPRDVVRSQDYLSSREWAEKVISGEAFSDILKPEFEITVTENVESNAMENLNINVDVVSIKSSMVNRLTDECFKKMSPVVEELTSRFCRSELSTKVKNMVDAGGIDEQIRQAATKYLDEHMGEEINRAVADYVKECAQRIVNKIPIIDNKIGELVTKSIKETAKKIVEGLEKDSKVPEMHKLLEVD